MKLDRGSGVLRVGGTALREIRVRGAELFALPIGGVKSVSGASI